MPDEHEVEIFRQALQAASAETLRLMLIDYQRYMRHQSYCLDEIRRIVETVETEAELRRRLTDMLERAEDYDADRMV